MRDPQLFLLQLDTAQVIVQLIQREVNRTRERRTQYKKLNDRVKWNPSA